MVSGVCYRLSGVHQGAQDRLLGFQHGVFDLQCHAKLVGGHKTAVSHLQSIPGRNALNPEEGLVSAGSDGSLAVWYPSAQAEKLGLLASQELASTATAKAHEGEIHSMTVVQSQSPEAGTESAHLYLVSSGE